MLSEHEFHGAMVAAENLCVYVRALYAAAQTVRHYEVVYAPPCVLLAGVEPVRPP